MSVSFFIKTKEKEKSSIGVSINYSGMKRIVLTIPNLQISPNEWENGKMKVSRGKQQNIYIQNDLNDMQMRIDQFFREFKRIHLANPQKDDFIKYLKSEKKIDEYFSPTKVFKILPIFKDLLKKRINGEILNNGKFWNIKTLQAYSTTLKSLYDFERIRKVQISNTNVVTQKLIVDFENFLTVHEGLKLNTVGSRMKNFKVLLGIIVSEGIIQINPFKMYKIPIVSEESTTIALDDNELKDMTNLDLGFNPKLDDVRNQFVLMCHLGVRISDFRIFNTLKKDSDIITFKNKKTGAEINLPIFQEARAILNKYENGKLKVISESDMNLLIKEVGKLVPGLNRQFIQEYTQGGKKVTNIRKRYEMLTLHCARRTGISRLASMGLNHHDIMIISGHKTLKSYFNYIKITKRDNLKAMIEIVNRKNEELLN